jgi:type I restriction-modification system DNA methylase subunit
MKNGFHHTKEAIKQRGEVFTPPKLVREMLNKLPSEVFTDPSKTFLDNSCGDGQFLFAVMERKMQNGITHKQALSTIYGVELDSKNAEACRNKLLKDSTSKELRAIVDHNIINADALDRDHLGWADVGFYWDENMKPNMSMLVENGEVSSGFETAVMYDPSTLWDWSKEWA